MQDIYNQTKSGTRNKVDNEKGGKRGDKGEDAEETKERDPLNETVHGSGQAKSGLCPTRTCPE